MEFSGLVGWFSHRGRVIKTHAVFICCQTKQAIEQTTWDAGDLRRHDARVTSMVTNTAIHACRFIIMSIISYTTYFVCFHSKRSTTLRQLHLWCIVPTNTNNLSRQWYEIMQFCKMIPRRLLAISGVNSSPCPHWAAPERWLYIFNGLYAVIARSIFTQIFTKTPHSSPVRARYGVSFVRIASDWYSASVIIVPYAKSCYVGPRYNGTPLYNDVMALAWNLQ